MCCDVAWVLQHKLHWLFCGFPFQGRTITDFLIVLRANYVKGPDPQNEGRENPHAFR